jgi:general stress protein 26
MSENEKSHGRQFSSSMSDAVREQLLRQQSECTFIWQADKEAAGTIMSFVWANGCVWLTTNDSRPRVAAVRKHRRASVVISSAGTELGDSRCITMRGACAVLDDRKTADWFYPLFCQKLLPDNPRAQTAMQGMLDRDGQIILCLTPEKIIGYDGDALMRKIENL